ncbi:MAG: DUF3817 domain-containing protein [Aeromicrobium sp.]|uniref:DUF3817 domain-containing protein n=1 Tax=Aeromicrobium sp. TaxID=1871063 RepID=UPI0039E293C6
MTPEATRTWFRLIAFAEAVSWGLLLSAMFFKYVLEAEPFGLAEGGVPVAGPIHGVIFVFYLLACLVAWIVFRWSPIVGVIALIAAIPPFSTAIFEVVADKRGLLSPK